MRETQLTDGDESTWEGQEEDQQEFRPEIEHFRRTGKQKLVTHQRYGEERTTAEQRAGQESVGGMVWSLIHTSTTHREYEK